MAATLNGDVQGESRGQRMAMVERHGRAATSVLGAAVLAALMFLWGATAQAGFRSHLDAWRGSQDTQGPVGACVVAWPECLDLAEGGDPRAQYLVGYAYFMGYQVRNGGAEIALQWMKQAARQRLPLAMVQLGRMYRAGNGTDRDVTRAAMWFELAQTLAVSEDTIWKARDESDRLKVQMTEAQMSESHRLARDWLLRNPDDGMPPMPPFRPRRLDHPHDR